MTGRRVRKFHKNTAQIYKKHVHRHAVRIAKSSSRGIHRVYRGSQPHVKRATFHVVRTTRKAHHHAAVRPHNYLVVKWSWYDRWHQHPRHQHAHYSVLVVFVAIVGTILTISYRNTYALSDLSNTWDFSNASNYVIDDGLETSGSSLRMKAQNYATDANTSALFHFDEANGSTAADSSGNANNGTVTGASFGAGNLNNALTFDGQDQYVSVPDSVSLSLSQQNSLEAWTKFPTTYSAGSASQRNGIVDKGDYSLYYDNETGKVTYELANSSANSWDMAAGNDVKGSWDTSGKRSVNAVTKIGANIYVGIGVDIGDAAVWKWDGSTWTRIGGGPASVNNSWAAQTFEGVYALTTDGTNLYAGLGSTAGDGEVWKWDGSSWSKIGGDAVNNSWPVNTNEMVLSLDYFSGKVYAALGTSTSDAEVWEWNGSTWSKIGGDGINSGWPTGYEFVGAITNDGTNLYAGLGSTVNDAEVWRWNGSTWSKIGGDGLSSSWNSSYESVRSLRYFSGKLFAGLGDGAGDAEVWEWNGSTWSKIGGDAVNSSWADATYEQVSAFAWDGSNLYTGLGISNGDGEVWKWDGATWTKIGGDAQDGSWTTAQGDTVNALLYDSGTLYAGTYDSAGSGWLYTWDTTSWTLIGGDYVNRSWGFYGVNAVQVMQNVGSYLYAGLGNTAGAALVWQFDGTSWTLIGGQGVNNSWAPNTYEQVLSIASYKGKLYVGLGVSAGDAEVWEWNGSTWTKIGGNSINSGWANNYESVDALASDDTYLYAGLGVSRGDGEIWRYDGTTWEQIGGDGMNSGPPTNTYERVASMGFYHGRLVAGLGASAGDAEVWEWNGSTWTKFGGDGMNSGWDNTIEQVEALIPYNDKLYAGLGNTTGDGDVWEWDGSTWTQVGGDDINSSWTSGTYERVKTMAVYNGDLMVGLGAGAGDGEVWRYDGTTWTKLAGNGLNGGWTNTIEEVESFSAYKGKFYAGTGLSNNADGNIWSWGDNAFLQSNTASFDTNWHHVAATYDGTTMKIYIDGVLDATKNVSNFIPDSTHPLLIGASFGGREYGKARGYFDGQIDEVRISNVARTNFTTKPYSSTAQTVTLAEPVRPSGVWHWDTFTADETLNGGTVTYRLSDDDGSTWKYWDGSNWVTSANTSQANPASVINDHIDSFPITFSGLKWQAVLQSDGAQRIILNGVDAAATSDLIVPSSNASSLTALKANAGTALSENAWTNGSSPYFSWTAGADDESGVRGYCLYLGTDNTADPVTAKGVLGTSPTATGGNCQFIVGATDIDTAVAGYIGTGLATSNDPYYLRLKTIDRAGNVGAETAQFAFKFDNTNPTNPNFISAPSGFVNDKAVTLSWPTAGGGAANDADSGVVGLQYKIGDSPWYGDIHSGTGDSNDLLANDGSYTIQETPDFDNLAEGVNTVYFRTWDAAGNVSPTYVTAALKINTAGAPSEPQNVAVSPSSNTNNAFAFAWLPPASFVGSASTVTYCYTINLLPSASNCTFTSPGVTSLGSGPYATQPGLNTFYIVAKDESGNINYDSYASATFTANTPAPGIPGNADIVDVSIKATNNWRLALTWDQPTYTGAGVSSYRIYRSTDNTTFSLVGSSSSTTYIDAGLTQQRYYYRVRACDNTNNCGADSTAVDLIPTGKFTSAATLVSDPVVSNITTRKARINWSTDRSSDSKIAFGTQSGKYSSAEVAVSAQVSAHQIDLDNLSAGTTYYFVAKWTDEDGNTGVSQEYTFITSPAPSLKEVDTAKIGLSSTTVQFTSRDASRVSILFGKSESFGGIQNINTSRAESTYTAELSGLDDGTKYFYKLISYDSEGNAYDGNIFSFSTPPRPRINNLRFQPVQGEPTSTQKVTWQTNVASTTTVTYGKVGTNGTDIQHSDLVTEHEMVIRDLEDDSEYFILAQSRDRDGNLATSDRQVFRTALDTRPPRISNITVEPSIRGTGAEARGQVVVSWTTDELATSQVAFAEGSGATVFNNKTAEDAGLSFEHIVIVSDLPTSKVYSIQPVSRDKSGNAGTGEVESAIIGRASDSVLTIVLNTLRKVFGF